MLHMPYLQHIDTQEQPVVAPAVDSLVTTALPMVVLPKRNGSVPKQLTLSPLRPGQAGTKMHAVLMKETL